MIFRVTAGGGAIESTSVLTDENGIASGGAWVMGQTPGINRLTATVQAPIARGNPVQFSANGMP